MTASLDNQTNQCRYLIVLGNFHHMGGAERQAFHFIEYLRTTLNVPVAVLGWFGEGPLTMPLRELGCEIFHFPYNEKKTGRRKFLMLYQLAQFIRHQIKPDVILPFVSVHSKPVCLIWKWTGAHYIWWNQQDEGRGLFKSKMEQRALNNAVHITSNSRAGAEFISENYDIPYENIVVYNNGTPIPEAHKLKPIWRDKIGVKQNQLLVSMVANIIPFKDHDTLFRAWSLVIKSARTTSLPLPILALAGHLLDAKHVLGLKALAFDLGLGDSVRFLGPIDTTNELLYESDIVVHSSIKEGCPNAVCEAMALGRAVVGTDISGIRQALGDDHVELVYAKPHDPVDLADKINTLLHDEALRKELGAANLQRIKTSFSIQGMNEFLFRLIQKAS
ncbi:glycosyltransferase family 4 protein [Cerasicoccus arenae]|uniref:Glycosyltransferase n=1 Tax=Cerasicoccus arenae TaxID=424488 RepID=A0A8J3GDJ4_9BACT|nr:glycosyltransferase family 4 protein [Cerasicoccus arenae]MBK1857052.1 glycosyltransferase family 4 protein [Cerasicoccus arenae]GHB92084.1 hypothetical protein GCM10007047_03860 [Cerasicoccus arenae]